MLGSSRGSDTSASPLDAPPQPQLCHADATTSCMVLFPPPPTSHGLTPLSESGAFALHTARPRARSPPLAAAIPYYTSFCQYTSLLSARRRLCLAACPSLRSSTTTTSPSSRVQWRREDRLLMAAVSVATMPTILFIALPQCFLFCHWHCCLFLLLYHTYHDCPALTRIWQTVTRIPPPRALTDRGSTWMQETNGQVIWTWPCEAAGLA